MNPQNICLQKLFPTSHCISYYVHHTTVRMPRAITLRRRNRRQKAKAETIQRAMRRKLVTACLRKTRKRREAIKREIDEYGSYERKDTAPSSSPRKTKGTRVVDASIVEKMFTNDFVCDNIDNVYVRCGYNLFDSRSRVLPRDRTQEYSRMRTRLEQRLRASRAATMLTNLRVRTRLVKKENKLHSVLNTISHFTSSHVWTVELRPGRWKITAVCGDPCYAKPARLFVNGRAVVDETNVPCGKYAVGYVTLDVHDGIVRVVGSGDIKSEATRLCFMTFEPRFFFKNTRRRKRQISSDARTTELIPFVGAWNSSSLASISQSSLSIDVRPYRDRANVVSIIRRSSDSTEDELRDTKTLDLIFSTANWPTKGHVLPGVYVCSEKKTSGWQAQGTRMYTLQRMCRRDNSDDDDDDAEADGDDKWDVRKDTTTYEVILSPDGNLVTFPQSSPLFAWTRHLDPVSTEFRISFGPKNHDVPPGFIADGRPSAQLAATLKQRARRWGTDHKTFWERFCPNFSCSDDLVHDSILNIRREKSSQKVRDIVRHVTHVSTVSTQILLMSVSRWRSMRDSSDHKRLSVEQDLSVSISQVGLWRRILQNYVGCHFLLAQTHCWHPGALWLFSSCKQNVVKDLTGCGCDMELVPTRISVDAKASCAFGLRCASYAARTVASIHNRHLHSTSPMMSALANARDVSSLESVFHACTGCSDREDLDKNGPPSSSSSNEVELIPAFSFKRPVPMREGPSWDASIHGHLGVGSRDNLSCTSILVNRNGREFDSWLRLTGYRKSTRLERPSSPLFVPLRSKSGKQVLWKERRSNQVQLASMIVPVRRVQFAKTFVRPGLTVEAWVMPRQNTRGGSIVRITTPTHLEEFYSTRLSEDKERGWFLTQNTNSTISFGIYLRRVEPTRGPLALRYDQTFDSHKLVTVHSQFRLPPCEYSHVAVTCDALDLRLFVNGKLERTTSLLTTKQSIGARSPFVLDYDFSTAERGNTLCLLSGLSNHGLAFSGDILCVRVVPTCLGPADFLIPSSCRDPHATATPSP